MAGEKDKDKPFHHNPFRNLKGLCVSAPPVKKPEKEAGPLPASPPAAEDEETLFAEEMARLGVERPTEVPTGPAEPGGEEREGEPPRSDEALFLEALQGMDTVFEDELPSPDEAHRPPRRMKLLRRGRLLPEANLDLHGLTRDEAREKVRYFLDNAVYQGKRTVLIVTGRGKGSGGEPVLRAEMERYLTHEAGAWVVEWGRAPRQYGGEGALVVFLKGGKGGS